MKYEINNAVCALMCRLHALYNTLHILYLTNPRSVAVMMIILMMKVMHMIMSRTFVSFYSLLCSLITISSCDRVSLFKMHIDN